MGKKANKDGAKVKKKMRVSLVQKILAVSLGPLGVLAIVLALYGVNSIQTGMQSEVMERLHTTLEMFEGICDALDAGEFTLDSRNNLYKGSYNMTANTVMLDSLVADTDIDITLFYDKTRRATTLIDQTTKERMIGTDASEEVYNAVVKNGETYSTYDLTINGLHYYAYYTPMKDSSGKIIGMYFAGAQVDEINAFIQSKAMSLILCAVIVGVISVVFITIFSMNMRKAINEANTAVGILSEGDLNARIAQKALKRGDELGDIARAVQRLQQELLQVMSKVKESANTLLTSGKQLSSMASQTSTTADEIGHAVEDISKGAVSQAEEIETASARIKCWYIRCNIRKYEDCR